MRTVSTATATSTSPAGVRRLLALVAAVACVLALLVATEPPRLALAHPDHCQDKTEQTDDGECFTDEQIAAMDDSGADLEPGEVASSQNLHLLANLPKSGPFTGESAFMSDIAFQGRYAYQGNYNGFQITDISDPEQPRIVSQVSCPGSQNDISVYGTLVFTSTDSRRSDDGCESFALTSKTVPSSTDPNAEYWEGVKVFDVSDPTAPVRLTSVETDCGSHTHTLLPDLGNGRLLLYVSSYDLNAAAKDCRLTGTPEDDHDKISIIEVPLADPAAARVIAEPVLFPDGGFPGSPSTRQTRGCHDITVYPALGLAAGACMGEGILMDISDPVSPQVLSSVRDPNFAFWHSATFTNDGDTVVFTDELGGGGAPTCNPTVGSTRGADILYDVSDPASPTFLSYFKIPRTQSNTENCVAHNGNFLPVAGRDIYVQAWYQGGVSVIDMTDPTAPTEIGFFDRGPLSAERRILGGSWSAYFYNGFIYSNDIQQGLDVLKLTGPEAAGAARHRVPRLNAQTQGPLGT
jgi:hypothetical protein